jgi:hypothetical protein
MFGDQFVICSAQSDTSVTTALRYLDDAIDTELGWLTPTLQHILLCRLHEELTRRLADTLLCAT